MIERTTSGGSWARGALLAACVLAGCGGGASSAGHCGDPLTIDDLEDGDRFICETAGRHGSWSVVGDGTSTNLSPSGDFTPTLIPDARDGSRYAARMTGFGFTNWGAAMGVSLDGKGSDVATYDASAYGGVRFWMKSDVPIYVTFPTAETVAAGEPGGTCTDTPTEYNCGNPYSFRISAPPPGEWREYDVPLSAGEQRFTTFDANSNYLGGSAVWDPRHLLGVGFQTYYAPTFDVWIDDLRFYACAGSACVPTCTDPEHPVACPAAPGVAADCWPTGTDCSKVRPVSLSALWGSGPSDVWTVAYRAAPDTTGAVVHWDGSAWSIVHEAPVSISAVWGSSPSDVWVAGEQGTVLHWDGAAWTAYDSGTTSPIFDMWGSGPSDIWGVGGGGTIIHWDGSHWSSTIIDASESIYRVWGSSGTDVWAAASPAQVLGGSVLHWDGTAWASTVVVGAMAGPYGVWGSGPGDVWVVGWNGEIVHWDGAAWSSVPSGTDQRLTDAWGSGPDDVWAVGDAGTILHWNGLAWSPVPSGTTLRLWGVWGSGPDDVWAAGVLGTILHWDGVAWTRSTTDGLR